MKKYTIIIVLLATVFSISTVSATTDTTKEVQKVSDQAVKKIEGKAIHEKACTRCHNSAVYTRTDRKITSLDALEKRVRGCNANTGANLFPQELKAVTEFLNSTYYKF